MRRSNVVVTAPGHVALEEEDLPPLTDGRVLLDTVVTGVSAGTELAFVKGDHVETSTELDRELGLFRPRTATAGSVYPVRRLGYMEVARVADSRHAAVSAGDLVAAAYGHASAHVADPVTEHLVPLPADLDPVLGVYVAHMGPICANGLLHAAAQATPVPRSLADGVAGRCVAVVGAGTVGVLVGLLCRHHGAADVVVLEEDPRRRATVEALGLQAWDPGPGSDTEAATESAAALRTRWRHGAADHGADVVFQCRGRSRALSTALRTARPQGTVVDLAFYTEPAGAVHLGAEFHHNGLTLVSAQIGRTPRGTAHAWDRRRLSRETIDLLDARGADVRRHLLTDLEEFEEAPTVLTDLAARRRSSVGLAFTREPHRPR
jgi:threonine dehydrogenase-like Zn-dependent dehydrogenase